MTVAPRMPSLADRFLSGHGGGGPWRAAAEKAEAMHQLRLAPKKLAGIRQAVGAPADGDGVGWGDPRVHVFSLRVEAAVERAARLPPARDRRGDQLCHRGVLGRSARYRVPAVDAARASPGTKPPESQWEWGVRTARRVGACLA
jgi:hypothetical protein